MKVYNNNKKGTDDSRRRKPGPVAEARISGRAPNAICIQIAQLAPCCYDNGTQQLPEFIWKWNKKEKAAGGVESLIKK